MGNDNENMGKWKNGKSALVERIPLLGLSDSESEDGKLVPGLWRQDSASESFLSLQLPSTGHNATTEAKRLREWFSEYFVNEGAIEWQWGRC